VAFLYRLELHGWGIGVLAGVPVDSNITGRRRGESTCGRR
jgi:hypothetical protein